MTMNLESRSGLPTQDANKIFSLLKSIKGDSGEERHAQWLQEIKNGSFSFGSEDITYIAKGHGSWKHKAIGQRAAADTGRESFPFRKSFLHSNWKLFHDALQAHRLEVLHDILPEYGISAA
jgi:hypothetical protein